MGARGQGRNRRAAASMKTDFPDRVVFPTARSRFDPPDGLLELREDQPLCLLESVDGRPNWLVTSYHLAREVLRDSRFGVEVRPDATVAGLRYPAGGDPHVTTFRANQPKAIPGDML